jgi:hypothetical protein
MIYGSTSRTLHDNYGADGQLRSQINVIDKTKAPLVNSSQVLVPVHWVILGLAGLTAIAIILTAAITVVVLAPRPGFYNESCSNRSCLSALNLKCINKTCLCTSDQYYTNKCVDKKTYLEKCGSITLHCKNKTSLVCRDGVCKCIDSEYWDGSRCLSKKTYSQSCTSDLQCVSDSIIYCDLTKQKCLCPSGRYEFS